mgnify:CR=1 FL=1
MSLPTARLTDVGVGICCCHPPIPCIPMVGMLVTASSNYITNGLGEARLGDVMLGNCGHPGTMITCSNRSLINGLGTVRISDAFSGCFTGVVVTGSPNRLVG